MGSPSWAGILLCTKMANVEPKSSLGNVYAHLSNHGSIVIGARSPEHRSNIMNYIHGNIALELGREENSDWPNHFYECRGRAIPIMTDEDAEERLEGGRGGRS